jgi:hypothetical protein
MMTSFGMYVGCGSKPVPGYVSIGAAVVSGAQVGFRQVPPAQPPDWLGPASLPELLPEVLPELPPLLLPELEPEVLPDPPPELPPDPDPPLLVPEPPLLPLDPLPLVLPPELAPLLPVPLLLDPLLPPDVPPLAPPLLPSPAVWLVPHPHATAAASKATGTCRTPMIIAFSRGAQAMRARFPARVALGSLVLCESSNVCLRYASWIVPEPHRATPATTT